MEGLYAASGFEIPYEDTAKGKVKDWLANYKKMFGTDANTQAIIGYNAIETFAYYVNKAGKDLTGQKMLDALESGDKFLDIFNSPPTKFSKTDHLANTVTQVQQIQKGRWVLVKDNLIVLSALSLDHEGLRDKSARSPFRSVMPGLVTRASTSWPH